MRCTMWLACVMLCGCGNAQRKTVAPSAQAKPIVTSVAATEISAGPESTIERDNQKPIPKDHKAVMQDLIEQAKALGIEKELGVTADTVYGILDEKYHKGKDFTKYSDKQFCDTLEESLLAVPESVVRMKIKFAVGIQKHDFEAEQHRKDALKRAMDSN